MVRGETLSLEAVPGLTRAEKKLKLFKAPHKMCFEKMKVGKHPCTNLLRSLSCKNMKRNINLCVDGRGGVREQQ